ncbi:multidrug efflux SMR transporter [Clostridium sediminicola]|uniref:DMT family transporter n=1 Tax=Clostridium sediminicola TaxID=3114879 RepID=UPI0031F206AC
MHWMYLFLAIIFELLATTLMKISQGLTRIIPAIGMFTSYIICFVLLAIALKKIEIGVAYAVWSGLGIAVISVIGIVFFKETTSVLKIASIIIIILGVVGLNISGINH